MNSNLRNLIKFVRENEPEIHWIGSRDSLVFCIGRGCVDPFLDLMDSIEDGGYECSWMGYYFGIDMAEFIREYCDIDIEDFCLIIGVEKE
jgi:hypothetical protein